MKPIIYYANLAKKILDNSNESTNDKKIIKELFDKDEKLILEKIRLRLTVIDSIYSTNMGRRLFGISDLAKKILKLSTVDDKADDSILSSKIKDFINAINNGKNGSIGDALEEPFGINKFGEKSGVATSLMSKYFYFLMGYKFPIYDSLVKDYLKEINKKFKPTIIDCNKFKGFSSPLNFFKIISEFNETSQIKCFDRLDNLCWLYGKIDKGSFSLILSKDNYKKLIKKINVQFF